MGLQEELGLYGAGLTSKPALLIANKADKVADADAAVEQLRQSTGLPIALVSGQTGAGMAQLKQLLRRMSPADVFK